MSLYRSLSSSTCPPTTSQPNYHDNHPAIETFFTHYLSFSCPLMTDSQQARQEIRVRGENYFSRHIPGDNTNHPLSENGWPTWGDIKSSDSPCWTSSFPSVMMLLFSDSLCLITAFFLIMIVLHIFLCIRNYIIGTVFNKNSFIFSTSNNIFLWRLGKVTFHFFLFLLLIINKEKETSEVCIIPNHVKDVFPVVCPYQPNVSFHSVLLDCGGS